MEVKLEVLFTAYFVCVIKKFQVFLFKPILDLETRFGFIDIKSSPIHFFFQRKSDFQLQNAIINFDLERLNVGGAMNRNTGVFTATRSGTYHFSFAFTNSFDKNNNSIFIRKNGVALGAAHTDGTSQILMHSAIPATLKLKLGDTVDLFKKEKRNHQPSRTDPYTHFIGWLMEEDFDENSISTKQPTISASKLIDPVCHVKGFPKSCKDLRCRGHSTDGFYMIQSVSVEKKIDTVYCEFSNSISSRSGGIYF